MLQNIFLWFYCLSIKDAIVMIIFVSVAYLLFRQWLSNKHFWRPVITVLLLTWLTVISIATLTDRTTGDVLMKPQFFPFHSYRAVMAGGNKEILRSNFMNMILFYPAGLFACELLPKSWSRVKRVTLIAVLFAMMSVGIEFCQYRFALGQAEVDDVIHNTWGALLGALVCTVHIVWEPCKSKE